MIDTWEQACEASLTQLLWGSRSEIDPLVSWEATKYKEQFVAQFDNLNPHLFGIENLTKSAWQRLTHEGLTPNVTGICSLLARKQHDYGHSNITSFGQRGIIVRLSDKLSRLHNLDRYDLDPSNESLVDTLIDIIGYCTISHMLAQDTFRLPLAEDVVM